MVSLLNYGQVIGSGRTQSSPSARWRSPSGIDLPCAAAARLAQRRERDWPWNAALRQKFLPNSRVWLDVRPMGLLQVSQTGVRLSSPKSTLPMFVLTMHSPVRSTT